LNRLDENRRHFVRRDQAREHRIEMLERARARIGAVTHRIRKRRVEDAG